MFLAALVCLVVAISDGDTLTVHCGPDRFEQHQVRIHAIDAPERYQSFADASRSSLTDLCLNIRARIRQVTTDGYGRTVAEVECQGEDAARHQVRSGMAWVYTRYAGTRADLVALQAQARWARVGLWVDHDPMPPWAWRPISSPTD